VAIFADLAGIQFLHIAHGLQKRHPKLLILLFQKADRFNQFFDVHFLILGFVHTSGSFPAAAMRFPYLRRPGTLFFRAEAGSARI
jgi:hypothetical protein